MVELNQLENGQEERVESDITKDGSLDRHGKPALKKNTGGWRCGMLLLVNQGLVTLAFAGVEVNLVLFSKSVLRHTNAEAAHTFSGWMGTVYLFSLIGAFLSDSYLGRYLTCVIFQVIYIIGLISLSLSTHLFLVRPHGCGKIGEPCEPHKPFEIAMFYVSIYLIALGNGASEPALATFGADQFDEEDPKEGRSKASFYSYFYVALNLGSLVAETVLVYIENMGFWALGFWVCTACAIVGYALLLCGSLRYRHFKPCGNPISRFSQVIVASLRKLGQRLPSNAEELFEVCGKESETNGTRRILHTNGFRFLDRAAIVVTTSAEEEETGTISGWRLCTVSQVEEVKRMARLIPIWLCTIFSSVVFVQMMSLFVLQGSAMDTSLFGDAFRVPPASMTVFDIVATSAFIAVLAPLLPSPGPSPLRRAGLGLAAAAPAMLAAAVLERRRLARSLAPESSSLSVLWQAPQYVLVGVSEALVYVAQMEFFAAEAPEGLRSLGVGLCMASSAVGSYVAGGILAAVAKLTSSGGGGWVARNLNEGHLDRFFFLMAALAGFNFLLYVFCAARYKSVECSEKTDNCSNGCTTSSDKDECDQN